MAKNFMIGTNFWLKLNQKSKRIFSNVFEILGEEYKTKRGDVAELVRKTGVARQTAKQYLSIVSLVANTLKNRDIVAHLQLDQMSGSTVARETLKIYADISSSSAQSEINESEVAKTDNGATEKSPTHPAIASLDDARRHFLDVVGRNVTLEKENASLKAENATLTKEVSQLREVEKTLRARLQTKEELLASLRSTLSKDTNGGTALAGMPIAATKKDDKKSMVLAYDLPTSTPAIPPWANREVPIQYSARFLKALDALHPETRKVVVGQMKDLVSKGRKATQTSQDHKRYNGHMVKVPEGTMISRGTKKIRYLWQYKIDGEKRLITFHLVGQHTEYWESEK